MLVRLSTALLAFLFFFHGCSSPTASQPLQLKYRAAGPSPEILALYEPWFGHPSHITIDYSSHDPSVIQRQIKQAKSMGISAFVVDWYGDREPFNDRTYALMQEAAEKNKFHVAMMYDESNNDDDATDEAIADFTMFHETYLASSAVGHQAYLTYQGRPVIFIFPKGGHTDWNRVRSVVEKWNPAPFLIQENLPGADAAAFDGFYAWINPGAQGFKPDGSNWGQSYLDDFYRTMASKYPDKMIVEGAWSNFDDSKASWGLNRHIDPRCGQTLSDTFNYWSRNFPKDQVPPFLMIETWNDYEEGTAIEKGISTCGVPPKDQQLSSFFVPRSDSKQQP